MRITRALFAGLYGAALVVILASSPGSVSLQAQPIAHHHLTFNPSAALDATQAEFDHWPTDLANCITYQPGGQCQDSDDTVDDDD